MPAEATYVGRPGPWGNPFHVDRLSTGMWRLWPAPGPFELFASKDAAVNAAVSAYAAWLRSEVGPNYFSVDSGTYSRDWVTQHAAARLGGRDLACWCRLDQPCHADVLLRLANGDGRRR
jgi:uncharacterized protein DUF4326